MENKNISLEEFMLLDSDRIEQKKKLPLVGAMAILIGLIFFVISILNIFQECMVSLFVLMLGFISYIYGIVKIFSKEYSYIDKQTKKELKKYELAFDSKDTNRIVACYMKRDFREVGGLHKGQNSGSILHLYGTEDGSLFYSSLLKYIPYQYEPVSECVKHTERAENDGIMEMIRRYHQ